MIVSFELTNKNTHWRSESLLKLDFGVWTYDFLTVQKNVEVFKNLVKREQNLDIDVKLTNIIWGDYAKKMADILASSEPMDVIYVASDWLVKWIKAGWLAPIQRYHSDIIDYKEDLEQFDIENMSYKGEMYGLPYYSGFYAFMYNERLLERAGFDEPPKTWDEVLEQSLKMKKGGIVKYPVVFPLLIKGKYPGFSVTFFGMAQSYPNGGCFDKELNPKFDSGSPAFNVFSWLINAIYKHKILSAQSLEMGTDDAVNSMKMANNAFIICPSYALANLNTKKGLPSYDVTQPTPSKVAGEVKLALMPETGHTAGYTQMYALTNKGANRGSKIIAIVWRLIEFFGGKTDVNDKGVKEYYIVKKWAIERGLTFGIKSLWKDPDVLKVFGEWCDIEMMRKQKELTMSKMGNKAPWFLDWMTFVANPWTKALEKRMPIEEALNAAAKEWNRLKETSQT